MVRIMDIDPDADMDVFENDQFELVGEGQEGCWHY